MPDQDDPELQFDVILKNNKIKNKRILIEKTFRYLLCNQRTQKCVAKVKIGGNCQGFGPGFNDIEKNCRDKILLQQIKKSKFLTIFVF